MEAIPNEDRTGIVGAVIAKCENFQPIPGTEVHIDGIDCINICTGLLPDNQLLRKGAEVFGRACYGVGDAVRIGEGTSAVLRGRQCAYEVMMDLGKRVDYSNYLTISKDYVDSQQRPVRLLDKPAMPTGERRVSKGFVIAAITKSSTSVTPVIDYDKCIGCMECVAQCPGLAIFGYRQDRSQLFLPLEFNLPEGAKEVFLVDDNGKKVGTGEIERVIPKPNKTNIAVIKATSLEGPITDARGFILKENYPEPLQMVPCEADGAETYVCHCEDVSLKEILEALKGRKSITAQELKHVTRLGMGPCRGSRCLPRAKQILRSRGIEVTGEFTPRGPMANLVEIGNVSNLTGAHTLVTSPQFSDAKVEEVGAFVAGGGMAGTALFRYLAEAGLKPVLVNKEHGSSWRCIAGGRPAFSVPALAEIANGNLQIFRDLQKQHDIDFKMTRYVNFVHDEATYKSLDASRAWSDAYMIDRKDFAREISPYINPDLDIYTHALISNDCWQASPGKTIDTVRLIGIGLGGQVMEDTELIDVAKDGKTFLVTVQTADGRYRKFKTAIFVNALGAGAEKFARMLGLDTGLFPVRHQAFITKRLPLIGKDGDSLDMLIDRRHYKGFSAVYGQQLAATGQIIGCASPATDASEAGKNLKVNTQAFLEIATEVFTEWIPQLKGMSLQATWCGYYTEPRYIVDPAAGLFVGMRGHGFMLSQYIAKLYVDTLLGRPVPAFFADLGLAGSGLSENAFK